MKKEITILIAIVLLFSLAIMSVATDDLTKELERLKTASANNKYEQVVGNSILDKYGEKYNEIYKKGWIAGSNYEVEEYNDPEKSYDSEISNTIAVAKTDGKFDGYKDGYEAGLIIYKNAENDYLYKYKQDNNAYQVNYKESYESAYSQGYTTAKPIGIRLNVYRIIAFAAILYVIFTIIERIIKKRKSKNEN